MNNLETVQKVEELLHDTLKEVTGMSKDMEAVKHSQVVMARSHETLAIAAKSMAATFEKSEERQSKLEQTNQALYRHKGVSPNVFFLVTGTLCGVITLGMVAITNTSVKATITSFEAGKRQAQIVQAAKDELREKEDAKDGS